MSLADFLLCSPTRCRIDFATTKAPAGESAFRLRLINVVSGDGRTQVVGDKLGVFVRRVSFKTVDMVDG